MITYLNTISVNFREGLQLNIWRMGQEQIEKKLFFSA